MLELADRNFNEWWVQRNRDPDRLNYGIFLVQKNVRGRNETLKLKLQAGFTGKTELFYNIPYLHKDQKAGLNLSFSYIFSKSVAYGLNQHQLLYIEGEDYLIRRFYSGAEYIYRNKFYTWHKGEVLFHWQSIGDTIAQLNPGYFNNSQTDRKFITLNYTFINDKRDIQYYATKGHLFKLGLQKTGLDLLNDLNLFSVTGEFDFYYPLSKSWYFASGVSASFSTPKNQPFYNFQALGYESQYVRGYELYVINGQHFGLWKNSLKFKLLQTIKNVEAVPLKQFSTIPLSIFLTANFDLGYVYDYSPGEGNELLTNRLLPGGGLGLDFVTFYDIVVRTEVSINKLGETGFYLHFMSAIGGESKF